MITMNAFDIWDARIRTKARRSGRMYWRQLLYRRYLQQKNPEQVRSSYIRVTPHYDGHRIRFTLDSQTLSDHTPMPFTMPFIMLLNKRKIQVQGAVASDAYYEGQYTGWISLDEAWNKCVLYEGANQHRRKDS